MSFDIDPERLQFLREEALGGACSTKVMDLAYDANQLMDGKEWMQVGGPGVELTVFNHHGEEVLLSSNLYFQKGKTGEDKWVEIGFRGLDYDFFLPVVSLNDRSGTGQCSVAILDPLNASTVHWAESIIATTKDESRPFDKNDNDEIQYAADMVDIISELISDIHNPDKLKMFAEKFRVDELSRLNTKIIVNDTPEIYVPYQETPLMFLERRIQRRLAGMAMGETVTLQRVVNEKGRLSESHIIESSLTRSGVGGVLNWDVKFGKPDHIIGPTTSIVPGVILKTEDGAGKFISTDQDLSLGELSQTQIELIESLATEEGYRRIFKLPPAKFDRGREFLVSGAVDTDKIKRLIGKGSVEDFAQTLSDLSDFISRCPSIVREPDIHKAIENFETLLKAFQERFSEEFDLLDLGHISLPAAMPNTAPPFLWEVRNVKADIYAPGWEVFRGANGCNESTVRHAKAAFRGSRNINNCTAILVEDAFSNIANGKNLHAVNVDAAFYNPRFIEDCSVKNANYAFCIDRGSETAIIGKRIINCHAEKTVNAFIALRSPRSVSKDLDTKRTKEYRRMEVFDSSWKVGIRKKKIGPQS